ncbi:MAG: 5'-nucleotidase C-terminal domain-containing protein [Chloroflexi bacterium]|nr:5'-nucleotidase C-terminal domain-containing protein [Chloroflexota bacterium]
MSVQFVRKWAVAGLCSAAMATIVLSQAAPARADSLVQLTDAFTSRDSGLRETSVGDTVADAVRSAGSAQVGLVQSEALRPVDLPRGSAHISTFLGAFTFSQDPVVVMTLTGDVLRSALERGVGSLPAASPGFLQVSGLAFTLNTGSRSGSRIGTIEVNGRALDRSASYTVAMPRSLAQGAAGYFLVWPAGVSTHTLPSTLSDALTEYLSEHDTLSPAARRIIP